MQLLVSLKILAGLKMVGLKAVACLTLAGSSAKPGGRVVYSGLYSAVQRCADGDLSIISYNTLYSATQANQVLLMLDIGGGELYDVEVVVQCLAHVPHTLVRNKII